MTMVPSSQIFINHQQFYDGSGYGDSYTETICFMNRLVGYESFSTCLGSGQFLDSPLMAEEESRISSVNEEKEEEDDEEAGCSSSKDEKWLQLGLGTGSSSSSSPQLNNEHMMMKSRLLELDLLPASSSGAQQVMRPLIPSFQHSIPPRHPSNTTTSMAANINTPIFLQHPRFNSLSFPQHDQQVTTWGYRSHPHPWAPSSSQIALGPYYPRGSFQQQQQHSVGPSSSARIIDPPRRPDSNIWFSLQASQNQNKQPFLPQIPKSYLRIKDGKMTVQVLIKYLATKLRLDSESEVTFTKCFLFSSLLSSVSVKLKAKLKLVDSLTRN
ncbi:hypothetical protein ACHQM5_007720 [Ranunculus cassubicifolius]